MLRVITEIRPRFVLAENVRGAVNLALDTVRMGLEERGYRVWALVVPASAFGAPHRRERLFVVGIRKSMADAYDYGRVDGQNEKHTGESRLDALGDFVHGGEIMADACEERQQRGCEPGIYGEAPKEPTVEQFAGRGLGAMWATPTSCGNNNRAGAGPHSGDGLATQIKREEASGGVLNPAWVEQLMGFPEGWTDLDVDEPRPWRGWPAPMGMGMWGTPNAAPCGMTAKTSGRPIEKSTHLETQVYCAGTDPYGAPRAQSGQYPYEFPRTVKGGKRRVERLKALGNAVVPQQAYPIFRAIAEMDKLERSCVNA